MIPTPEQLAAFADGQLDPAEAAAVSAAIAQDPALASNVAAHQALRAKLQQRFAPVADEPVPDRLAALIQAADSTVIDFAAAKARRKAAMRWTWIAGPAIAASLALFLTLRGPADASYAPDEIAAVLDGQLTSEQPANAPVRVLLSFRDGNGGFCRAYAARDRSAIACRDKQGWKLQASDRGQTGTVTTQYRQAASPASILAQAQAMASGPALDGQAERDARANGWQR
ncbi:MAG: anti-sigma factor family protein [Novosphingobium sp.]